MIFYGFNCAVKWLLLKNVVQRLIYLSKNVQKQWNFLLKSVAHCSVEGYNRINIEVAEVSG